MGDPSQSLFPKGLPGQSGLCLRRARYQDILPRLARRPDAQSNH